MFNFYLIINLGGKKMQSVRLEKCFSLNKYFKYFTLKRNYIKDSRYFFR